MKPPGAVRGIGAALALSVVASLGLTAVYWLGGHPQVEGILLLMSLGGLGVAFVLWGKYLLPPGPYVEEREPLEAPEADQREMERDLRAGGMDIGRRTFLRRLLLGALGALGLAAVFPIRSLGPRPGQALFRTAWTPGARLVTPEGEPVRVDRLVSGGIITVFPEGRTEASDAQTLLIRVDPATLRPIAGREDWSPEGHLAYSKLCTHAGCPVGLYEQATHQLFCPCHQSVFDVLDGAAPVAGPATRPLPQLPIAVDGQGYLRAQGDFSEPAGPGFWELG